MSYFLRVFCQSNQTVSHIEIADFIRDGYYFDEPPRIEVQLRAEGANETDWKFINVDYETGKRPVSIQRNVNDKVLQQEIDEIIEIISRYGQSELQQNLARKIAASQQVIAIEIVPQSLTDAAWGMLDCLEAHLAKTLSGIIYAPDDGFYDEKLQPIYKLGTPVSIG